MLVLEDSTVYENLDGSISIRFGNYNHEVVNSSQQDKKIEEIEANLMNVEPESTYLEVNRILDASDNELMIKYDNNKTKAIEILDKEYNTQYIEDVSRKNGCNSDF